MSETPRDRAQNGISAAKRPASHPARAYWLFDARPLVTVLGAMAADESQGESEQAAGAAGAAGSSPDSGASGQAPKPHQPNDDGERTLNEIVEDLSLFPLEAFRFVEEGLTFAANEIHGQLPSGKPVPSASRHVSGQQLCEGLRRYALLQWGLLAQTVLRRWNITCTLDFGRIVFALIDAGRLQKTDHDSIDDFRNVFDFRAAFEQDYRIEHKP